MFVFEGPFDHLLELLNRLGRRKGRHAGDAIQKDIRPFEYRPKPPPESLRAHLLPQPACSFRAAVGAVDVEWAGGAGFPANAAQVTLPPFSSSRRRRHARADCCITLGASAPTVALLTLARDESRRPLRQPPRTCIGMGIAVVGVRPDATLAGRPSGARTGGGRAPASARMRASAPPRLESLLLFARQAGVSTIGWHASGRGR